MERKSLEIARKGKEDSLKVERITQRVQESSAAGVFVSKLSAKAESVKHEKRKQRILESINKQKEEVEGKKKRLADQ